MASPPVRRRSSRLYRNVLIGFSQQRGKLVFGGEAPRPISLPTLAIDAHRSPLDRNSSVNCCLKRRALHPNACPGGPSSICSWVPLGIALDTRCEPIRPFPWYPYRFFPQQNNQIAITDRYRAVPNGPSTQGHLSTHWQRALPAKFQFFRLLQYKHNDGRQAE